MCFKKPILLLILAVAFTFSSQAQRSYASNSVLSSGEWYKIAITKPGVYIINRQLLNDLGAPAGSFSSLSLYGNHGRMLPENPSAIITDDLARVPLLKINSGAEEVFCFYAPGTNEWVYDPVLQQFSCIKNIYSDTAYYYLSFGNRKDISLMEIPAAQPVDVIDSYHWRYFYEKDSFNLLNSGKEWLGEDMGFLPGKPLKINIIPEKEGSFYSGAGKISGRMVARTFGMPAKVSVVVNEQAIGELSVPPVGTGLYDVFAREGEFSNVFTATSEKPTISFTLTEGSGNAQAWLDKFVLEMPAKLTMNTAQLDFRNTNISVSGEVYRYIIENAPSDTRVLKVTDPFNPELVSIETLGSGISFLYRSNQQDEFIAFSYDNLLNPLPAGRVALQNLHNLPEHDYLIITHTLLRPAAERLSQFHKQKNLYKVEIVETDQIFNEFSSGQPNPVAIRDFLKMSFDRAGNDSLKRVKHLLLLGAGSFDPKNRHKPNYNLVPTWQTDNSLDPLSTYVSDDFFGFLNDADSLNNPIPPLLDIAIGRIPARNLAEANAIIDKIIAYHQPESLGPWRRNISFIADDEDNNLHLLDAETISDRTEKEFPYGLTEKIYLDAYRQESTPAGNRYPSVRQNLINNFYKGVLIWNYTGHGGNRRLAEEVIFDSELVDKLKNQNKLPLMVVATCDFTPFDHPLVYSLGEEILFKPHTGAIALMSATRLVFAASNSLIHDNYLHVLFSKSNSGKYKTLGEASREVKNLNYAVYGDVINNRKFALLGDPGMRLAFPEYSIVTTEINGKAIDSDTLKALQKTVISGEIRDHAGALITGFNGTIYPVVIDKPAFLQTLGNDAGSSPVGYLAYNRRLYNGSASVNGGKFSFEFVVPGDIQYQYGKGKISYYATDGSIDAGGGSNEIIIGGTGGGTTDKTGPEIKLFLNDEQFVNGGIVNEQPILLVKLEDSSGINISGTGPGHNLLAVLNGNEEFILNEYYNSEKDDYTRGTIRYQLPLLEPGVHHIKVTAWDAANNPAEAMIDFRVVGDDKLVLKNVINYPNPFTTRTNFWFDHNKPGEELQVQIQIYTISGKIVKTLRNTIFSTGNRSNEIFWDGRDDFGQKLARGVYIYSITVQSADGKLARKMEKVYIL